MRIPSSTPDRDRIRDLLRQWLVPAWRRWIVPAIVVFLVPIGVWILAAMTLSSGAASVLPYEVQLGSSLLADYSEDPIGETFSELRLSIVNDVLGGGSLEEAASQDQEAIDRMLSEPVPTVTPEKPTDQPTSSPTDTPVSEPSATSSPEPTATAVPPEPSSTPIPPPTESAGPTPDCSKISISSMWIDGNDEVRARVHNRNPFSAYLVHTVFEWPDVPAPAHVDWFQFGNSKYFSKDDYSSPTVASGTWVRFRRGDTETWRVDFDDQPGEGLYGSFAVSLTFRYRGWGNCEVSGSTFKSIPPTETPNPEPTDSPSPLPPTETATPEPTSTPGPSDTPEPTFTSQPSETPVPTDTPTAVVPTDTPEPTAAATDTPTPEIPSPTPTS